MQMIMHKIGLRTTKYLRRITYGHPQQLPIRVNGTVRDSYDHRDVMWNAPDMTRNSSDTKHPMTAGDMRQQSGMEGTEVSRSRAPKLKSCVDFRNRTNIRVYDQGDIGSCAANAVCSTFTYTFGYANFDPSRLFLYYNSRHMELSACYDKDRGASLRNSFKAFNRYGICDENLWPHCKNLVLMKPNRRCYSEAYKSVSMAYERLLEHESKRIVRYSLDDIHQLKSCLHQGSPFVFCFDVYDNFNTVDIRQDSMMPFPSGKCTDGQHAVMAVGYKDYHPSHQKCTDGYVIVLNSWGSNWGDKGFFYMPYHIIVDPNYCFDFWRVSFRPAT